MEENESSMGIMGVPGDELLKIVVDKVIDNGTAIKEAREQIRKLAVQNEAMEDLQLQMERLDKNFKAVEKALTAGQEETGKLLTGYQDTIKSRIVEFEKKVDPDKLIDGMGKLQRDLFKHTEYFEKPARKEIHHRHFLGWPLVTLFGMFVSVGLLVFAWVRALEKAGRYEDNDIKWRYLKLRADRSSNDYLISVQKMQKENPKQFKKDVEAEEEHQMELNERLENGRKAR